MSSSDPKHELTRLERLASVLREDDVDIEKLDGPGLNQYLKDNKIDMGGPQRRIDALLKKAKARRQLELARLRRLQAGEKARQVLSAGSATFEEVRARVRAMIEGIRQHLRQHHPEQALFYAREYEKATPEDMQTLEEDLTLLELEQPENGERDKQDPS
jgi:hypothetical protein